jgi:hypothetical protein
MFSLQQIDEMFAEIINLSSNPNGMDPQEADYVGNILQQLGAHCGASNLTIPRSMIERNNPDSLNNYVRGEVARSESRIETNRNKMRMFELAHSILS